MIPMNDINEWTECDEMKELYERIRWMNYMNEWGELMRWMTKMNQ